MESHERENIIRLAESNYKLKKLFTNHEKYEQRVRALSNKTHLTMAEELELRETKMMKLRGKEEMMSILSAAA